MTPSHLPSRYATTPSRTASSVGFGGVPANTETVAGSRWVSTDAAMPAPCTPASVTSNGRRIPSASNSVGKLLIAPKSKIVVVKYPMVDTVTLLPTTTKLLHRQTFLFVGYLTSDDCEGNEIGVWLEHTSR